MYNRFRDHLRKKDRGSVLLEAIASLAIISFLTLGYTATATSATLTQRTAVNDSIATQVTQGVFETARATQWSKIGTKTKPVAGLLPASAGEIFEISDALPAVTTKTVRGLKVTVRTAVGWQDKPGAGSDFGTKMVVVDVDWRDNEADASSANSRRESTIITPGIGEAAPSGVRAADETAVPDRPAVPTLSGSIIPEGPKIRATWNQIENATGYTLLYRKSGETSWSTQSVFHPTGEMILDVKHGDTFELRVRADSPAGSSEYSNMVTITVSSALAAPVVTGSLNSGNGNFAWDAIPTALSYSYERRINGGPWTGGATIFHNQQIPGSPGTSLEFRVRANTLTASGPWSAVVKLAVPPLPPTPEVTGTAIPSAGGTFTVNFNWTATETEAIAQYQINNGPWTPATALTWAGTTNSFVTLQVPAGSTVTLSLRATGYPGGQNGLAAITTVDVDAIPATPVVTGKLDPAAESVVFTWPQMFSFGSGYRVEYRYGTGAWTLLDAANKTFSVSVAAKGSSVVSVRVRVNTNKGSSSWGVASVTAPTTPIGWKYEASDGAGVLGKSTSGEVASHRGGKYQLFERGSIHWTPQHGAFISPDGSIRTVFLGAGGHSGYLGYAISDVIRGLAGDGAKQEFEGGHIFWQFSAGARIVTGSIYRAYEDFGAESSGLGYPISGETYGLKQGGSFQDFQNGAIISHPQLGSYISAGAIRNAWFQQGFENGPMGYPTSNEFTLADNRVRQTYQGGTYTWSPVDGKVTKS